VARSGGGCGLPSGRKLRLRKNTSSSLLHPCVFCALTNCCDSRPALICAHVVVTNLDEDNPLLFSYELGGRAPPAGGATMLTAQRIFGPGKVLGNLTTDDGSAWLPVRAWLAPAETGIYRIGCDAVKAPAANATNLALADDEAPALRASPGWSRPGYGGVDALTQMTSDTTVAKDGRYPSLALSHAES
jgi:hypothetical protein